MDQDTRGNTNLVKSVELANLSTQVEINIKGIGWMVSNKVRESSMIKIETSWGKGYGKMANLFKNENDAM